MDFSKKFSNPNPEPEANIISRLFFLWQIPLFRKGLQKDLEVSDLYSARDVDNSENLADELEENWNKEIKKAKLANRKPKFMNALSATYWKIYFLWGILLFIQACLIRAFVPVILANVILYFNDDRPYTKNEGYIYATILVGITFVSSLMMFQTFGGLQTIGMRARIASCSLMYRKTLRLSQKSLGEVAAGKIVNLMSNDVTRFDQAPALTHYIWIMPMQLVIMSYLMYESVGISAFAGLGCITIQAIPIQGLISRQMAKIRMSFAKRTDERIHLMNEIVNGIQVIKMYAWEKPFEITVRLARKYEIDRLLVQSYFRGFSCALMVYTERLSLFVTLITFVFMGNNITSDKVFSMAQFFNTLQLFMAINFPLSIVFRGEAMISAKRIGEFLMMEENTDTPLPIENNLYNDYKKENKIGVVELDHVSASWIEPHITPTLSEINFTIKPGQLCAVIGPVGAGKSSILHLLLKELPIKSGNVNVHGKVAFCSQEPWLFQGSVRNNILFGQNYDKQKYKDTVKACALVRDFEQFPHEDKTLVGDRGSSLSGGQKARVNLARAVYREADIYLFDDPLSAVDTQVGKHLFDKCVVGYLRNKTRILVTHQLQFLEKADVIVVLDNGRISKMGTWDEISKDQSIFESIKSSQADGDKTLEEPPTPEPTDARKRLYSEASQKSIENDEDDDPQETAELMEKGALAGSVFWKYLRSGGSLCFLIFLIIILIMSQVVCSGADWWSTQWTNMEDIRRTYLTKVGNNNTHPTPLNISTYIDPMAVQNDTFLVTYSGKTIITQQMSIYVYLVLIILSVVLTSASRMIFFKMAMNASTNLHDTMFSNILQATMRFFDTNPSGRILNRFSKDMGSIDEMLPRCLLDALQIFLVMMGILTMVGLVNPYLMIIMVVAAWCFNKIRIIYMKTAQDIKRLEGITRSPAFSQVSASLDGLTTIRACGAQRILAKEFDEQQNVHTGAFYLTLATGLAFGLWLDVVSMTFLGFVVYSFLFLDDGSTFSGNVGLAISQTMILTGMLQYGMRQTTEVMNQMTSVERVLQYTKLEKEGPFESEPGKKPKNEWPQSGKVDFKHAFLSYIPEEGPVLKDLNINISSGDKVGIVGRTGAGKSSLISALFRLAPLDGDICIDDISTKSVGLTDLRTRISIIPQTPVLFSSTLRYNLDPFNKSDDASLWKALEEVELKDVAESLDHKVNEGGSNFSVGQRQLLCLARAIVRNNKVLVLDEATANVDLRTDALIQTTIRKKFADCTVLTIAHRLNTIMDSDKVLVMDAGCMVEFDHPHNLLQNKEGYFSKMLAETGVNMEAQLRQVAEEAYNTKYNITE